jgi:hypothetical protein
MFCTTVKYNIVLIAQTDKRLLCCWNMEFESGGWHTIEKLKQSNEATQMKKQSNKVTKK